MGEMVDLASLNQALDDRFASILDQQVEKEDQGEEGQRRAPPKPISGGSLSGDGAVALLEKMELAQHRTDAQLDMIAKQMKELTAAVSQIRIG